MAGNVITAYLTTFFDTSAIISQRDAVRANELDGIGRRMNSAAEDAIDSLAEIQNQIGPVAQAEFDTASFYVTWLSVLEQINEAISDLDQVTKRNGKSGQPGLRLVVENSRVAAG